MDRKFRINKLIRITTIVTGLIFLTSCDCFREVTGTVIDKKTRQPIGYAEITILGSNNSTTADSLGNFHLNIINSGLECYCKPKNKVTISSPLYLTDTFKLNKSRYKLYKQP